jgi:RimJ/RimL family protein N-acetyltransferase
MALLLETPRFLLRPWHDADLPLFRDMNADPEVMEFLPSVADAKETAAQAARIRLHFDRHGFGPWAVQEKFGEDFLGFVGLLVVGFQAHFTPAVEVAWRLRRQAWGRGVATESAGGALDFAFGKGGLAEIVSFTVPANRRSRAVMERLGMQWQPAEDFDHPALPEGHALRRHVLYRLKSADWVSRPGRRPA